MGMDILRRGIVTDEYRVQMQQAERYNNTPTLHVPVTVQPGVGNDPANKTNYYNIEVCLRNQRDQI